jgi:NO-binding membrane sensor protein with MHYT domain
MTGSHHPVLVVVSVLIAMLASYTALQLAGRVAAASGWVRRAWLASGSVAMGVGIWSMHFVAMLAFHLPVPITYDVPLWLLSILIAVLASWLALFIASRKRVGHWTLAAGAVVMGAAIAAMHYTGMAAVRISG